MKLRLRIEHRLAPALVLLAKFADSLIVRAVGLSGWAALVYWCLAAWHLVR